MGSMGRVKKWRCDYCSERIEVSKIGTGWLQASLRDGNVILTACPEHSGRLRELLDKNIKDKPNEEIDIISW